MQLAINSGQEHRPHQDILDIFAAERQAPHGFLRVSAPMVRYSKLEFRRLLRQQGVKLCFTPMIIADSFNNSQKARDNEFTTCAEDVPIIAQFAARDALEFANAAQLVYPYVDGVDLNCGCPQSWAIAKGYGCGLLRKPELVRDIVQTTRRLLPQPFSVSLKIRLLCGGGDETIRATVALARQLEKCGASFMTLHGRTMWQRTSDPLNIPAMAAVKQALQVPLIVNGNVRSWQDACELHALTQADGVMAARGLLANPTLFNPEYEEQTSTPIDCVQQWLDIATRAGDNLHFQCFHHHLTFMWSSHMKRKLRLEFNNIMRKKQVFDFFEERYGLKPTAKAKLEPYEYTKCSYTHFTPVLGDNGHNYESPGPPKEAWNENTTGKFFKEFNDEVEAEEERDAFELEGSFFTENGY